MGPLPNRTGTLIRRGRDIRRAQARRKGHVKTEQEALPETNFWSLDLRLPVSRTMRK